MDSYDRRQTWLDTAVQQIISKVDDASTATGLELGRLSRETRRLGHGLAGEIRDSREALDGSLKEVFGQQEKTLEKQDESISLLTQIDGKLTQYLEQHLIARQQELARAELEEVKNELRDESRRHHEVRRKTRQLILALDEKPMSPARLAELTDVSGIEANHWLGRAQYILARWYGNDEGSVQQHLRQIPQRDNQRTSLFFALINAKIGRTEEAADWLCRYLGLRRTHPVDREFRQVLNAALLGVFGPPARSQVITFCAGLSNPPGAKSNRPRVLAERIDGLQRDVGAVEGEIAHTFPGLNECRNHAQVTSWYRPTTAFQHLHDLLAPLQNRTTGEPPDGVIDGMLDELVAAPTPREADLQRRWAHLGRTLGFDETLAPAGTSGEDHRHRTIVDLFTDLTMSPEPPEESEACTALRQLALGAVSRHLTDAIGTVRRRNADAPDPGAQVDIADWPETITHGASLQDLHEGLSGAYNSTTRAMMREASRNRSWLGWAAAGVLGLLTSAWAYDAGGAPPVIVLLAVAGAGSIVVAWMTHRRIPGAVYRIKHSRDKERIQAEARLDRVHAAYQHLCKSREENLALAETLIGLVGRVPNPASYQPAYRPTPSRTDLPYPAWSI